MEHCTAGINYGEATEGGDATTSPNQRRINTRKRGRLNNSSSNDYVHSKSSRQNDNNDTACGSVDSLVFSRKQKRDQDNDGLDPLVDSNNNTNNSIDNNYNEKSNDNIKNNNKTICITSQQHQQSTQTVSDHCQLKTPTKQCNGIDENVYNYTGCDTASSPPSPKRIKKKNTTPFSPVKTHSECNSDAVTSQSRRNIPLGVDNNASSSAIKMDAATLQTFIELLCSDYITNANQQKALHTLYSLTPDNPLHVIEMCKVMQEALHDLERIRNGEIKGEDEILRVWNKYRDRIASAYPDEYRDLINQGTAPNPDARSMTLQNFATKNALALQSLVDLDTYNLVLGACPRLMEQTFARYLAHDITGHGGHDISLVRSGLTYQQDVVSFGFDALSAADEGKDRDTHHDDNMDEFCRAVGQRFDKDMAAAINIINIMFSGELCYSVHGVPMRLLLGTPKAEQYMFDSGLIGTDGRITRRLNIVGPAIPHSQQWWDDFIKSNYDDEKKAQICATMWRFYLPLLQKLGIGREESITTVRTRIAYKWGKEMTQDEIEVKKQGRREMGQRKSKIWDAVKAGKALNEKQNYVKNNFFYKSMLGWEKFKEDPSTVPLDLQVIIVKSIAWKAHKAKILGMGEEGAEQASQISSIEASASAEMVRRKAEKERVKAEMEKKRLESINKELETIEKIEVEKRTPMQTIRFNLLRATRDGDRREQVHWRDQQRMEKKRLKAEKAAIKREEIDSQIKSLSTINRTEEEEFQFNVLNAELRGDKKEVKQLRIEKKLKAIPPNNRTELQQIDFDLLNAQLRGHKKEVKQLRIEKKAADEKAKEEKKRLRIEKKAAEEKAKEEEWLKVEKQREQRRQHQEQLLMQRQLGVVSPWLGQAEQQQQQQLVQQQFLLSQEEQRLNLIQQQYSTIGIRTAAASAVLQRQLEERLLQIQQQKQQNLEAYMQLQSRQYLQQLQSQQQQKFTKDEDLRLWKAFNEKGRKWALISKESFTGTRSGDRLRVRFMTLEFKNRIDATFGTGTYDGFRIEKKAAEGPSPQEQPVDRPAKKSGEWSAKEHSQFHAGVIALGWGRWKGISEQYVLTRSRSQVQSYSPTYLKKNQVTFQVQVPQGLQVGHQLQVVHPKTGATLSVDVPPGTAPGAMLSVTA